MISGPYSFNYLTPPLTILATLPPNVAVLDVIVILRDFWTNYPAYANLYIGTLISASQTWYADLGDASTWAPTDPFQGAVGSLMESSDPVAPYTTVRPRPFICPGPASLIVDLDVAPGSLAGSADVYILTAPLP